MTDEVEKKFVLQYIVKDKQDRLIYELGGKKRQNGIGRFCHDASVLLKAEKIIASGDELGFDEIIRIAEKNGASDSCHIIAYNGEFDKKNCSLKQALELVLGNGMASVIICGDVAIIETEQSFGAPERFILHG